MGARGNSGVILSQIIRGMARALAEVESIDAAAWVRGMEEGAGAAYQAVTKPVEGTILTVMREASEAARKALDSGSRDIVGIFETTVEAASESLERTPTLLPVLAEAGVVDAGGKGLLVLLDGMVRHLRGEPMEIPASVSAGEVGQEWLTVTSQLHEQEASLYGYCTEFLIGGAGLEPDGVREQMLLLGDSVLVVGDDRLVRVHLHTDDPGAALSHGTKAGSLLQVKVDNIRQQADRFLEMHEAQAEVDAQPGAISTVAVAAGKGMATVFRSVGCTKIVPGGPTMNPSTRDILDAVEACPSDDVIVLPNDKNIVMAAKQAAGLTQKRLRVVETNSIPQGIAAVLALNQDMDLEGNVAVMEEARQGVHTVEVCRAVRSTSVGGVQVREGQIIAIADDELKLAADTAEEGALRAVQDIEAVGASLVTLYHGADTRKADAESLADRIHAALPQYEVEIVDGGQPHYNYIISLE